MQHSGALVGSQNPEPALGGVVDDGMAREAPIFTKRRVASIQEVTKSGSFNSALGAAIAKGNTPQTANNSAAKDSSAHFAAYAYTDAPTQPVADKVTPTDKPTGSSEDSHEDAPDNSPDNAPDDSCLYDDSPPDSLMIVAPVYAAKGGHLYELQAELPAFLKSIVHFIAGAPTKQNQKKRNHSDPTAPPSKENSPRPLAEQAPRGELAPAARLLRNKPPPSKSLHSQTIPYIVRPTFVNPAKFPGSVPVRSVFETIADFVPFGLQVLLDSACAATPSYR
jgi:hypothetical protein